MKLKEIMSKELKRQCYSCSFRGDIFRVMNFPHCHCEHPSITKDISPWDSLRKIFDVCDDFALAIKDKIGEQI